MSVPARVVPVPVGAATDVVSGGGSVTSGVSRYAARFAA